MAAMAASTDGFLLAEKDLEIRGAGEVFGEASGGMERPEARAHPARRGDRHRGAPRWPRTSSTPTPTSPRTTQLREEVEDLLGDAVEFLFKS